MTSEYLSFEKNIKNHFYYYVHYNTGWEILFTAFNNQAVQLAFNKATNQNQTGPWQTFQRFHNSQKNLWTPRFEVPESISRKFEISNFLNQHMIGVIFNDFDIFLQDTLKAKQKLTNQLGSHWAKFEQSFNTSIQTPLVSRNNGGRIFAFMEMRHKIQHNNGIIDQKFIDRLNQNSIQHTYQIGDQIKLGIEELLSVINEIISFAKQIDLDIEKAFP